MEGSSVCPFSFHQITWYAFVLMSKLLLKFLLFTTQLTIAIYMSFLPGNHRARQLCDSTELPDVKKCKTDHSESSGKEHKDAPWTSILISDFHHKPTPRKTITLASKCDVPASAIKVTPSVSRPYSSLDEHHQQKQKQVQDQQPQDEAMDSSSEDKSHGVQDTNYDTGQVDATTIVKDASLSDGERQTETDGQWEMPTQMAKTEDGSCDTLEMLPFFKKDDLSEEISAGSRVDKTAAKGSESGTAERKHKKKPGKTVKETSKKPPPNAFVAVRIPSANIATKVKEVQETLLAKDKRLQSTFVPAGKNHITLMVMRLNDPEEIEKYVSREIL